MFDTSKVYTVTFGPSSGTVSCVNTSRSNVDVTSFNSINTLGPNTIQCTAKSGAGLSTSASGTITINVALGPDNVSVTGTAYKTETKVIAPPGGTQFGPYLQANKGCYHVVYYGNNLNTFPAGFQAYERIAVESRQDYEIKQLNYLSSDANYFVYLPSNTSGSGLETVFNNYGGNSIVEITNILIQYYGETCPN